MNRRRGATVVHSACPLHSYLELPARPESVRAARWHAGNVLREWGLDALIDTVELIVSEIATNAVRASDPDAEQDIMCLRLTSDRGGVLIQVWDSDPGRPCPRQAESDAEAGRGLLLIEALSVDWGCQPSETTAGKVVRALCR